MNATGPGVLVSLGLALLAEGRPAAALEVMQKEADENDRQYALALAYDAVGCRADADRALAVLETRHADSNAGQIASVHACRRESDKSFAWLDRAYRQHDLWLAAIRTGSCRKGLRDDPRYKALLKKLNPV